MVVVVVVDGGAGARVCRYQSSKARIETFLQSRYPRLYAADLTPVAKTPDAPISHWYPPGHGDIYLSLKRSGVLDKLQSEGIEYAFISNIDNLGASVDLPILQHMIKTQTDFVMEVTDKTNSDIKGGTLIKYEGRVKLLEVAQVPKKYVRLGSPGPPAVWSLGQATV